MKTRFYKILDKDKNIVYIGVTLRPITERFKEHLISKGLNENYSVIEFDCIEHPEFSTLEVFYGERKKVAELEQKYIKEELEKGSELLNVSEGGEWGGFILEKLNKEEFLKRFGSYDGYEEYKKKVDRVRAWLRSWVHCRSRSKVKVWVRHWVECRSKTKVEKWLRQWIRARSVKKHPAKEWVEDWVNSRSQHGVKRWLRNWVHNRSRSTIKQWLRNWVCNRSYSKVKRWLQNWIVNRK